MKIFSSALENFAVVVKLSNRLEILGSALLAGCSPIPQGRSPGGITGF